LLQDIAQEKASIVYYAFDLLRLNGKNLQALPIEELKAQLEELLKKPPGMIRYSVSFTKDIEELLGRARELGLEGLIGKRAGSRYEAGKRTGAWIKLKLHLEQEFFRRVYRSGRRPEIFWLVACRFLRRQEPEIRRKSRNRL
jgi:bifunctional non-homologous end joining protein LigD